MMSTPIPVTLPAPGPFWTFNREERNAVAVLFALLTRSGNLARFASLLDWQPDDLDHAEVSVEWTYLRDLWNCHAGGDQALLRTAILDGLLPPNAPALEVCSMVEFNAHFGAVPRPSEKFIQSPSNWSVSQFDETIADNDEFLRTCRFKWAFNVKPDLVVQTPSGHVLCIEAKWDSAEGVYPSSNQEKVIFQRRGIAPVSQTDIQRHLVNHLLGFTGAFAYLGRRAIATNAGRAITWGQVIEALDRSDTPPFVDQWCAALLSAQPPIR